MARRLELQPIANDATQTRHLRQGGQGPRVSRRCSFLAPSRDIGGADPLQCEPECNAFVDDAAQLLGHRDARILRGERWQLGEPFRDLAGAGEQLVGRNNFVDRAPFLRRLGIEFLASEDEIAAAYGADGFLPQQVDAITGRDA